MTAIEIVQEFMVADLENRGFFGDKYDMKRQRLTRLLKGLVAEQETVDEVEVYDLLVADVKSIRIVKTPMAAARGLGIQTKEFAKVFAHQKHFASLPPTDEFPAPKTLEREVQEVRKCGPKMLSEVQPRATRQMRRSRLRS